MQNKKRMQDKEFHYKGKKIFYRTKGEGPLVVLLHGFGEDGTIWKNQYDIFPNHQLIIPDLPGSGGSEMIDDVSMEGMAEVIKALMKDLTPTPLQRERGFAATQLLPIGASTQNIGSLQSGRSQHSQTPLWEGQGEAGSSQSGPRSEAPAPSPLGDKGATLIGHSMGGYITLAFVEKYPEALNRFGLFHSTAYADNEEKKETRRKGIEFMEKAGGYEFLKTAIPKLYAPASKATHPEWIEEQLANLRNVKTEALVIYYEAMMQRPDRTIVLRNSKVPVLFVLGRHDTAIPIEDGLKLCHLPQMAYIHILEASGHNGMIEEPEKANEILKAFITTG